MDPPLPEFETDKAHDYFVSRFFIHEHFYDNGDEKEDTTIPKLSPNVQRTILQIIRNNPNATRKDIASKLGLSVIGARYHINKMKDAGIITYVGTSRNGHWEILKELSD